MKKIYNEMIDCSIHEETLRFYFGRTRLGVDHIPRFSIDFKKILKKYSKKTDLIPFA